MGDAPIPLIMTRPAEASGRFVDQLPGSLAQKLAVIDSPLVEIVPETTTREINAGTAVIFTSSNGVRFAPKGQGRLAFCVGPHTTEAARRAGWDSTCCGETSDALVAALVAQPPAADLLHISGRHTRGQIIERLGAQGLNVARMVVYDQVLHPLTPRARAVLEEAKPAIVPIFSPRTAAQFAQECPEDARPYVIALSDSVAEPLSDLRLAALEITARPDAAAMVDSLEKLVARISLG